MSSIVWPGVIAIEVTHRQRVESLSMVCGSIGTDNL